MLPLATGVIVLSQRVFDSIIDVFKKVVSWTPMDAVSSFIMELVFQNEHLPPVLNVVHPKPTDWNTVIRLIGDSLVLHKILDSPPTFVSFQTWFSALQVHAQSANEDQLSTVRSIFL